jgi:hypothetical protein
MLMYDDEPEYVASEELSSISGSYKELMPIKLATPDKTIDKDSPIYPIVLDNFGD